MKDPDDVTRSIPESDEFAKGADFAFRSCLDLIESSDALHGTRQGGLRCAIEFERKINAKCAVEKSSRGTPS